MISGAARVAPEKAVFRPALPMSFTAGLIGQQMATKLTYKEQLLHPNWQRKRLERLEAADFACEKCEATEKTLHVHHRRYIKGRMAWEYEDSNFEVLCADCHEESHHEKEHVESEMARLHYSELRYLHGIMVGYRSGIVAEHGHDPAHVDGVLLGDEGHKGYAVGLLLKSFDDLDMVAVLQLDTIFNKLNPDGFVEWLSEAGAALGGKK